MGEDITIESIAIEITASADEAVKSLDKLISKLNELKAACQGGLDGADKVAKGIKKIAEAAQTLNGVNVDKIRDIASAIQALQNVGTIPNLSSFAKSISKVASAANDINGVDMAAFAANMQSVVSAMQPLNNLTGIGELSSAINALSCLPKATQGLSSIDMSKFAEQMQKITTAIQPFVAQMNSLATSFNGLPAPVLNAISALSNYNTQAAQSRDRTDQLGKSLKLVNFMAIYTMMKRVLGVMGGFITSSNAYVENLNLFTVSMGEAADEAMNFAQKVNDLMGIDISQWIQNQGYFKQLVSGFGMVEEKANLVSKNMTQLGYDIASYFNISVDDAMTKLQSGLAGEIEPLRRIGYALDAATLQQVAYNHGIETNLNNLSQAQKAQLRYIAIMEQSSNAMNDMARTLDSPANQLRILESRIETLKRAIGDSLMPVVSAALPYVTAFVQVLGDAFRSIAEFMGFELPVFDYSDTVSTNNEEIADSFNEATAASEKFKGSLAGIDQLNIIGSNTSSTPKGNQFGTDLDLQLPEYDFLKGLKEDTNEAYNAMKSFFDAVIPWVEAFGAAMAVAFTVKKVGGFITSLSNVKSAISSVFGSNATKFTKNLAGIAGGLAAGASSGILFYNSIKNLIKGTGTLGGNIASLAGGVAVFGTALGVFIKMKNPIGAILTVVGAVTGAVMGWVQAQKELDNELANTITFADNGGIAISGLADGFKSYFDTVSSGYDDILANSAAMEENKKKINEAAGEIKNITDKFVILGGEISEDNVNTIKGNIETIGDAVKDNLGLATQGIVDTLKTKFHDFAERLGMDVDNMVGKFYLLESMGNTALANLKQQAQGIVGEISNGGLSTEEMSKKLEELNGIVSKMYGSANATAENVGFNRALKEMFTSNVNMKDKDEVQRIIDDFNAQAKSATDTINSAWNSQIADLQNTKQQYINWGVDVQFDAQFGNGSFEKLFSDTEMALDAGYKAELKKIETGQAAFLGMLQNQLGKDAETFAKSKFATDGPGFGSTLKAFFTKGGLTMTGDQLYNQAISDLTQAYFDTEDVKKVQEAINSAMSGIDVSESEEIAKMIMYGMTNGIIKNQDDLNSALQTIALDGMDALKNAWDIHSPSKKSEKIAEYFMMGLDNGIVKNRQSLLGSIDETASLMTDRMSGIKIKAPQYTAEDVEKNLSGSYFNNNFSTSSQSVQQYQGADYQTVSKVGQAFSENGTPIEVNINLQSYVELDGDQVGEAAARYSKRQMAYTNGY